MQYKGFHFLQLIVLPNNMQHYAIEQGSHNAGVTGSSPVIATKLLY